MTRPLAMPMFFSVASVSYTHLDVYKRQARLCYGIPLAPVMTVGIGRRILIAVAAIRTGMLGIAAFGAGRVYNNSVEAAGQSFFTAIILGANMFVLRIRILCAFYMGPLAPGAVSYTHLFLGGKKESDPPPQPEPSPPSPPPSEEKPGLDGLLASLTGGGGGGGESNLGGLLSSLTGGGGGFDPALIGQLGGMLSKLNNKPDNRCILLNALKPYLRKERRDRVLSLIHIYRTRDLNFNNLQTVLIQMGATMGSNPTPPPQAPNA